MKKFWALLLTFLLPCSQAAAFSFPEPDWGALLAEKKTMVQTAELELYVEGNPDSAPYFGARLEPRSGAYLGMIAETSSPYSPLGGYLTYIDEMNQPDLYYPANRMIQQDPVLTTVGWTINSLGNVDYQKIRSVLDTLHSYQKPMLIRFANEMNVSSLGDDPAWYKEVFRTVADMVHEYPNFAVVWSPNDMGALDRPFHYFYPGDEYVDWIGVSSYMKRYFQGSKNTEEKSEIYFMTGTYAWATNALKPIVQFMEEYGIQKPLMISEGGVATNNRYGEDMTAWAEPRLRNFCWYTLMKYPQIKAINYFNTHRAMEVERFDISGYPYAEQIFLEAANNGAYLRSYGAVPRFVFQKAEKGGVLTAQDGIIPLYTLAYLPKQPQVQVHYYLDGNWISMGEQIPYHYGLDVRSVTDGWHTLTLRAGGLEHSYSFHKRDQRICFGDEVPQAEITVSLNGQLLSFEQPPVLLHERTMVPMRKIFEALGATVVWEDTTQRVTAEKDGLSVSLQIGNNRMQIGDQVITLDVAPQLIQDKTMVPVRAVSEAFRCHVDWDDTLQRVLIKT